MELQERIVGHLAENKFGCTARELSKSIGERLDLVQEHLLVMAAMSTVKSRLVGRDQVYMLVSGKAAVPTPRELLAQAQAAVDAAPPVSKPAPKPALAVKPVKGPTVVEPTPRPAPVAGPTVVEPTPSPAPVPPVAVAVPQRKRVHTPEITAKLEEGRAQRETFATQTGIDMKAVVASGFDANSGKPPRPSLYRHVGGTITLDVFGKPVTARFTSLEQLKKFVDDLIEAGRAPEKG